MPSRMTWGIITDMRGKLRKDKKIAYNLRKILPAPIVRLIVKLKGTGPLESPKNTGAINPDPLLCTIASNSYGSFCTPNSCKYDTPVQYIFRGEQYEQQTIEYIRSLNLPGDIIHAGAYFGDTLPGLATALSTNARIWAFEPNIESFRCAEITISLNDLQKVILKNLALNDATDELHLLKQTSENNGDLGGTARITTEETAGTQKITAVRLDDVIPEERIISLIHLDVEGFEKKALQGAQRIIADHQPIIIVEVNDQSVEDYLKELGYTRELELEPRELREGFRNAVFKKNS